MPKKAETMFTFIVLRCLNSNLAVVTSMEDAATSAVKVANVSAELWQMIAKFCVATHELRTVTHVCEDLSALQCVCKQTSMCTAGLWPSVAQLCEARPKQLAEQQPGYHSRTYAIKQYLNSQPVDVTGHKPALNTDWDVIAGLPTDMLTVFLQVQTDKAARIKQCRAKQQYFLTAEDLQTCKYLHKTKSHVKQVCEQAEEVQSVVAWHRVYEHTGRSGNCKSKMGQLGGPEPAEGC